MNLSRPEPELAEDRDGFRFRGGRNAIDLSATLQARLTPSPRELLKEPSDLARWFVAAGLASTTPETTVDDLRTAQTLREAIYTLAKSLHDYVVGAAEARNTLNHIAAGVPAVPQLQADGSLRHEGPASALLVTLAREAVLMFGGTEARQIKQCQSPECTLYFLDASRKGDRRWCSMSACGNKAKVAEFRRRKRSETPSS